MIEIVIAIVFLIGYAAIALEHNININKSATAIVLAVLCWLIYLIISDVSYEQITLSLSGHLSPIAEIVFFLMGAMAIVEIIDAHQGFRFITGFISTKSKRKLMWVVCGITFMLSAVLDNLTTAIVMVSILRKLIDDKEDRMIMASMIIIAANAGGAFSPIGDVTTTMLWIGGQVTASNIIVELFLPSIVALLIPLLYQSTKMKGQVLAPHTYDAPSTSLKQSKLIFGLGIFCLLMVPVFKQLTHLPAYMAMLFGLGILWIVTELMHARKEEAKHLRVSHILSKIDLNSLLFFAGILLAVACLESVGVLEHFANWLSIHITNHDVIVSVLGLLSSVIDNVPLVAATMGMYPLSSFATDHKIWEMIALCAGTGGSILIIGSAAGVVVMGMEKITFNWYLKKISVTALLGYAAAIATYLLIYSMMN